MRRKTHIFFFTLAFAVFISGHFLYSNYDSVKVVTTPRTDDRSVFSLRTKKYATKSLTELGTMDQSNKYFLFLNTVPKSGSEILILLLQKLQGVNNFKHVRMSDGNKRLLTITQQVIFSRKLFKILFSILQPRLLTKLDWNRFYSKYVYNVLVNILTCF